MKKKCMTVTSMAAIAASFSAGAYAQTDTIEDEEPLRVRTITVTADRRVENEQTVPISIAALDEEALELRSIADIEDLQATTPGLYFYEQTGQAYINVRGVGGEPNGGVLADPSVTVNVDGVTLARPASLKGAFYDLERVEVLKGPQGTLYGRNATGGTVNIISNAPELGTFESNADVAFGNYDFKEVRGVLNLPLGDKAAIRFSGIDTDRRGYFENVFDPGTDDDSDDEDSSYLRTLLRIEPTATMGLTFGAVMGSRDDRGQAQSYEVPLNPQPPLNVVLVNALPAPLEPRTIRQDAKTFSEEEDVVLFATLEQELDFGDLTVTLARVTGDTSSLTDGDATELDFSRVNSGVENEQLLGEVRLASNGDGPISWIVGASAIEEDNDLESFFNLSFPGAALAAILPPPPPGSPTLDPSLLPPIVVQTNEILTGGESSSYAVFGDMTVPISERFSVTGGLRYTYDEKNQNTTIATSFDVPGFPGNPPIKTMRSDDYSAVTGRLIAEYQLSEDNFLFASLSRGYKAGGFSVDIEATPYEPEFLTALEIGSKNTFMDGRLVLNGSVYYYDHTDLQVQTAREVATQSVLFIENSDSTTYGAELQAVYAVAPFLTIDGSLSVIDAVYDGFQSADPTAAPTPTADPMVFIPAPVLDLDGEQKVLSPNYTGTLGAQLMAPIPDRGFIVSRVDISFSDEVLLRPYRKEPADVQGSYVTLNANLTWRSEDQRYAVEVFGRNLTDEDVKSSSGAVRFDNPVTWQNPRIFGVRLGASF